MRVSWLLVATLWLLMGACASTLAADELSTATGAENQSPEKNDAVVTADATGSADDIDEASDAAPPVAKSPPTTSSTTTSPLVTTTSVATTSAAPAIPKFAATISEIDVTLRERMGASWREGCPVALDNLRYLTISHWDFSGKVSTGELVVHQDHAEPMREVMRTLFELEYPIQRMVLVDEYNADDDASMEDNNTSAFNCREVAWKPGVWSNHAFGTAIDVNPLVNPYVDGSNVFPPSGAAFADRSQRVLGGLYPGDAAVAAFAEIGWGWGGDWSGAKDWQHFSASGR